MQSMCDKVVLRVETILYELHPMDGKENGYSVKTATLGPIKHSKVESYNDSSN